MILALVKLVLTVAVFAAVVPLMMVARWMLMGLAWILWGSWRDEN